MSKNWNPEGRITSINVRVPEGVIWPLGYEPQTSYLLPEKAGKFYRRARVEFSEVRRKVTPSGAAYNADHETCGRCKGRGSTRKDGSVGCAVCLGTGAVRITEGVS